MAAMKLVGRRFMATVVVALAYMFAARPCAAWPTKPEPPPRDPRLAAWPPSQGYNEDVSAKCTARLLGNSVTDAAYSRALDHAVMVHYIWLHLVGEAGPLLSTRLKLPEDTTSVAVTPDGKHAAVGHHAHVSWVNLETAQVEAFWPIDILPGTVAAPDNGWIYVAPLIGEQVPLRALEVRTGKLVVLEGTRADSPRSFAFSEKARALYSVAASPEGITRLTLESRAVGGVSITRFQPPSRKLRTCGEVWSDTPGGHLFSRCGNVFLADRVPAADRRVLGALNLPGFGKQPGVIEHLAHSAATRRLYMIPFAPKSRLREVETPILEYDAESFEFIREFASPCRKRAGSARMHARYVFPMNSARELLVLGMVGPADGFPNHWAVALVPLNEG